MATTHFSTTVSSPTQIVAPTDGLGRDITIQNNGTQDALLGGPGVNGNDYGFRLVPGAAISFELDGQDGIWAVGDGMTNLNIMSVNLERVK